MIGSRVIALLCCGLGLLVASCAGSPTSRFYQLSADGGPAAPPSQVSVLVGPVSVPASIDRPQIVMTLGPNQVRLDEFNRWAAPVHSDIARVVAENLTRMLGTPRVFVMSQTLAAAPDYRAAIEVQRFESAPGQAATLDAVWTVIRTRDAMARTGRVSSREPASDATVDAVVAAHTRALATLSRAIADAVQGLEGPAR